ncbi:hypothetical protein HOY82DRAFT_672922 [Tuber indicum]|nr:hypothetical protein HOY82DRAFT_672922 [Tuber indicum]
MKTSIIASILGAALLVAAQTEAPSLSDLPSCAMPCAGDAVSGTGTGCQAGDIPCACRNEKFISDVSNCLRAACTDSQDIQKAISVAQGLCGTNLPSGAVSSIQANPTGNTTSSGSGNNSTRTTGGSGPGGSSGSATSTSKTGGAAGLVPGGFAIAAILAGLLAL